MNSIEASAFPTTHTLTWSRRGPYAVRILRVAGVTVRVAVPGLGRRGMSYNGEKWEKSADVEDNTHAIIKEMTVRMSSSCLWSRVMMRVVWTWTLVCVIVVFMHYQLILCIQTWVHPQPYALWYIRLYLTKLYVQVCAKSRESHGGGGEWASLEVPLKLEIDPSRGKASLTSKRSIHPSLSLLSLARLTRGVAFIK